MNTFLAVLDFTDFAIIAAIVVIFAGGGSLLARKRINLSRIERKLDAILKHHGIESPPLLSPEVQRLARDPRQKIAAIKLHREQNPELGLADARNQVEDYLESVKKKD